MSTLNPERWQEISPYLDEALSLDDGERARWLESLAASRPDLVEIVRKLLQEYVQLEQEHFLDSSPPPIVHEGALAGQTIGAYRLISPIGQGGMGTVWLAERCDGRFERRVAIKFLHFSLSNAAGAERFQREGRILGQLAHPHIAELIDAGVTTNGAPYLVLEYVEGKQIDEYCDACKLDIEKRIRLFLDVLGAVAHAHANLVVHRDIKPSNVLVRNDSQVKLLDFGIAKLLADQNTPGAATLLTAEHGGALTPQFAAPEQVSGGAVTTATDVYGLGVLLYLLLTGQHAAGPGLHSPADLVKAIVELDPPRASEAAASGDTQAVAEGRATTADKLRRLLRGDLDTIVAKALKKDPAERYGSVAAFAEDLQRYLRHEPISARPDTVAYRTRKFVRRNRVVVALSAAALAAVIAGAAGTLIQARTARRQRDFAYGQLSRAEQIDDLNVFLFTDASLSPKPLSVDQLLARAERVVDSEDYSTNPANHIGMLISIGQQYWFLDENDKAFRLLQAAYQLSRGLKDASVRARASCQFAASFSGMAQHERAESLYQEGLRELPAEAQFAPDRVFCFIRGSEIAQRRGAIQDAIGRAQSAQQALATSPFQSGDLNLQISINLANTYSLANRHRESLAEYQKASGLMTKLGYGETRTALILIEDQAFALTQAGQLFEAEKMFRRAIDMAGASKEEDAAAPSLLNNYAGVLRQLMRLPEAAHYAEAAYVKAKQIGDHTVIAQSLLNRARIYRDQRNFARASAMLTEVEPILRRDLPPGHYAFASLANERAWLAEAQGDLPTALRLNAEAVRITEGALKHGGQGYLGSMLSSRSLFELESGLADAASADAERALNLELATAEPGSFSATIGERYLALGKALKAQHKNAEARVAFYSAVENLEKTAGPDHPRTREARQLAEAIASQQQTP